jgi:hypothetical protein
MHAPEMVGYEWGDFGELVPFGTVIKTFNHAWSSRVRDLALVRAVSFVFLGIRFRREVSLET